MTHLSNEQLIDYIHGGLPPQADAAVYSHLEQCAACRGEYEAELSVGDLLRSHAAQTERELPSAVKAAIWAEVRNARPAAAFEHLRAWLRPAIALPAAAAIALAAYFGTAYLPGNGAPRIAAAYYLQDHAALESTVPFSDRNATPMELENANLSARGQVAVNAVAATYTADAGR